MEIINGLYNLRPRHQGCVLTIGNFDGVHRGHRQLIDALCDQAKVLGVPSMLMTFEQSSHAFSQIPIGHNCVAERIKERVRETSSPPHGERL